MEVNISGRSKVGVFDSGVGGLSVWRELIKELPFNDFVYLSDSAYCPYGPRTQEEITGRVCKAVDFLISQSVSIIVVACNTATAAAIETLRDRYDLPFVGMEPAVKPAAIHSRTGVIGVLATKATLNGKLYNNTLESYASGTKVVEKVGDGLVEAVERGETDSGKTENLLRKYIQPMLDAGADHIVLGCTHYPFLVKLIEKIAGNDVTVVDPAPSVARHTYNIMVEKGLVEKGENIALGETFFYSTGEMKDFKRIVRSINRNIKENTFKRIII